MKKLAIVFAVGAAALIGSTTANAANGEVKAKPSIGASQSTDVSARQRYHHRYHYGMHRHHYRHGYYRPYYNSYGYYQRPYGYYGGPGYYGGGPGVTFSFGTGGYRSW